MPEPSFDGRRRYGVLAAGAVGGLTLLLAVVTPALATGPGDAERDRRGPPRNVLLLHAYPRLSPPVVGVDEAFRATLEAESPFPVYFYTEYLDLTLLVARRAGAIEYLRKPFDDDSLIDAIHKAIGHS